MVALQTLIIQIDKWETEIRVLQSDYLGREGGLVPCVTFVFNNKGEEVKLLTPSADELCYVQTSALLCSNELCYV